MRLITMWARVIAPVECMARQFADLGIQLISRLADDVTLCETKRRPVP
jgi:hypothetical protein